MKKKWWVLASVACGTFMATLDSSIVNIALPTLTKEFHANLEQVKWVVITYLLVITCLLLPFGRVSDQFGRKRVFLTGFVTFTIGSLLCGTAPSLAWLVFYRVVQALGVSMLMANGPAIITAAFPAHERGTALGILAMVVSGGLLSGPSIGGILIGHVSWRAIFLVNIPIGIVAIALVGKFFEKDKLATQHPPFDWAGAFVQMILLLSFIVVFDPPNISISGSMPFPLSRWVLGTFIVALGALFFKIEADAQAPLFDFSLLRNRVFWTANLASYLTFVAYSAVSVLMPFFLEEVMGLKPARAGLFMTAIPLAIFIVAPIAGRLSDRWGSQGLSFAGALISAICLFAMAGVFGLGIHDQTSPWQTFMALAFIGLSMGLFQSPNNNAIMGAVPLEKLGVASALLATVRNLGLVTGTGLVTSIFSWKKAQTGSFIEALHFTQLVAGFVGLIAVAACLGKPRDSRRRPIPGPSSTAGTGQAGQPGNAS